MSAPVRVTFELQKETPGTFKFTEKLPNEFDTPKIGALYVKKPTLGEIGWERGQELVVLVGLNNGDL